MNPDQSDGAVSDAATMDVFVFPASYAQSRLWFLDQYIPEPAMFNIPLAIRLRGKLDVPALRESLRLVCQRHESLRTRFQWLNDQPHQVISPTVDLDFPVVVLEDLPESRRWNRAQALIEEEARRPFDLAKGPLFRSQLLRLSPKDHVVLLCHHHIVSDGWSVAILLRELKEFYRSICQSVEAQLPTLPVQYADFTLWQRDDFQGDGLKIPLAYWMKQLDGIPALLELPTDRSRPLIQSYRGAQAAFQFSQVLSEDLKSLGRQEGLTLFMTLLAGFQIFLARYSGQEDIVVGSPIAGRMRAEVEHLIGFFVNTLALRTDVSGNPTVRELLARVRLTALGAYEHQDLPFERLVEEINPQRSQSYSPLFQAMFVLQNDPKAEATFFGLEEHPEPIAGHHSMFDLSLSIWESRDGLQGVLDYSTDLFDAPTIQRMLVHFQRVLEAMVADPAQLILELPILTEVERQQVLVEWNDTQNVYPNRCIHQLFESQVVRTPEATALVFNTQSLSYRALNEKSNDVAHFLRKRGVGPGVLVGIFMDRSPEMVVGVMGVLKAGGAYVPLDPDHPKERLSFVLNDINADLVLIQKKLTDQLPACKATVIALDLDHLGTSPESEMNPSANAGIDDLAYVMYTSGSTGQPKGVEVSHRGVVSLLTGLGQALEVGPSDVLLALTTLSFDISVLELFLPLFHGASIELVDRATAMDGVALGEAMNQAGTTLMQATPATWQMLSQVGWQGRQGLKMLCGGETLPGDLARYLMDRGAGLWNLYGPTETTIWSATHPVGHEEAETIPIGRPVWNTQIYVLDAHMQPVPLGVKGEIYIGGDGLARGYLNRPELTFERFPASPFDAGKRLYKTGDLGRYLPDGNIDFLGRMDSQVKIRGHRIELGEIEAVLCQYPGVLRSVVDVREDVPGDKRIVAFLEETADPDAPFIIDSFGDFVRKKLPPYMVPTAFSLIKTFPIKNGKLDRQALRAIPISALVTRQQIRASNPTQMLLTQIWEELLNVHPIGILDDFFELGGHSLLVFAMLARLEKVFGRRLPITTFYSHTTIQSLSRLLADEPITVAESALAEVQAGQDKRPFFLLHGDMNGGGFYSRNLARHLDPDQPLYVIHPYGLAGQPSPKSIEIMATEHLKLMRAHQPVGPYLLGGYCNGALEAFEMAQQLHAAGQMVDLLVMIDPPAANMDPPETFPDELSSDLDLAKLPHDQRQQMVFNLFILAMSSYRPRPYPGSVTIFRSEGEFGLSDKTAQKWDELAGDVNLYTFMGGHLSTITKYVSAVGEQLRSCLTRVHP